MGTCCHSEDKNNPEVKATMRRGPDRLLLVSSFLVIAGYLLHLFLPGGFQGGYLSAYSHTVFLTVHQMWWGIFISFFFVGFLSRLPREIVINVLGTKKGIRGLLRATLAGLLLDLCSHGILLIGTKLYERGASTGQMMAFLVASPWNSFSLTLILITLIGLKWTMLFVFFSALIGIFTGWVVERLEDHKALPANRHRLQLSEDFKFRPAFKDFLKSQTFGPTYPLKLFFEGVRESMMILRWLLLGLVLVGLLRELLSEDQMRAFFGPSLLGLLATLGLATVIEVCSEGSAPIAADIMRTALAPGNSFTFLMAGVSTDYTELAAIRQVTGSWRVMWALPLVSIPQILLLGWIFNLLGP